jgi:hypothetical protein
LDKPSSTSAAIFVSAGVRLSQPLRACRCLAPSYPQDWDRASEVILGDEARFLAEADLYVLTPQMLDVVIAAAQTLNAGDLGLLREDDLPSPSGVVVLPRPLITRLPTRSLPQDIAYAWRSPWRIPLPESPAEPGAVVPDASPRWPWVSLVV